MRESRGRIKQRRDPIRAGNTELAGEVFRLRANLVTFLPTIEIAVVRGQKGANPLACSLRRRVRGGFSPPSL